MFAVFVMIPMTAAAHEEEASEVTAIIEEEKPASGTTAPEPEQPVSDPDSSDTEYPEETAARPEANTSQKATAAARVTAKGKTTNYTDFEKAVTAWNNAGAGAKLTLLSDIVIGDTITVGGGSETSPMILDLNDHGILCPMEGDSLICVLWIEDGGHLEVTDSSKTKTAYFIALDEYGRGVSADTQAPDDGTEYIEARGGFITGADRGVIFNEARFTMSGGTICGLNSLYVDAVSSPLGTFTMNGGTISRNAGNGLRCKIFTMNGGTISGNTGAGVIIEDEGSFTMSGGTISGNTGAGVIIEDEGSFTMNGGTISKNTDTGVACYNEFTMNDGTISENTGGGVACSGKFTMNDGTISGNTGTGVGISGNFVLKGGEISGNTALYSGGGVDCDNDSTFTMSGGKITGNSTEYYGGGVYSFGEITISGGEISGNTALYDGGGVFHRGDGTFTMSNGKISGNTAKGKGGGVSNAGTFDLAGGEISGNTARYGGGVRNERNGTFIIIGGEIKGNGIIDETDDDSAVSTYSGGGVSNAGTLTIEDGQIVRNTATDGGGVYNDGTLTIEDGQIVRNTAKGKGGGVSNASLFNMNGGTISGNSGDGSSAGSVTLNGEELAMAEAGGGVYNRGTFDLAGGEISGNAASSGGGIYNDYEFSMNGGEISGNAASYGSGVYNNRKFIMNRGEIKLNTSNYFSKAIYMGYMNNAYIDFGGGILVSYAINGTGAQIVDKDVAQEYINNYCYIRVVGAGVCTKEGNVSGFDDLSGAAEEWRSSGNGAALTLYDDYMIENPIEVTGGTEDDPMVLDLNDHGILYTGSVKSSVIKVGEGAAFELKDSNSKSDHYITLDEAGRATAAGTDKPQEGSFIQTEGGYISGGNAENGGGVRTNGIFAMSGGSICGNIASGSGGGVYAGADGSSFVMDIGEIRKNDAASGKAVYCDQGSASFRRDVSVSEKTDGSDAYLAPPAEARKKLNMYGSIVAKDLSGTMLFSYESIGPQIYTGSAIKPELKVHYGSTLLVPKKDYTVLYGRNTDAGIGTFTVTGKGNYDGKETGSFRIVQKNIGDTDVTVSEIPSAAYSKNRAYKPVPAVTYNKKKLVVNKDFYVTYFKDDGSGDEEENPKSGGKYIARITGRNNYTGNVDVPFVIAAEEKIPVSKLTVAKIPDEPYRKGEQIMPHPVIRNGAAALTEGDPHGTDGDYVLSYGKNNEIGKGTVIITGRGSYEGSRTVTFNITGVLMSKVAVQGFEQTKTYDGTEQSQNITLSFKSGKDDTPVAAATQKEYDDLTTDEERRAVGVIISYKNNVSAGTATMVLTGINGYIGTVNKTFRIAPFDVSNDPEDDFKVTVPSSVVPYAKAGSKPEPTVTFKGGEPLKEGVDYTLSYTNNTAVNDWTDPKKKPAIKVTGKGNFKGTDATATFKITAVNMSTAGVKVVANDVIFADKEGNWKTKKITVVDGDGKVLKAGTDYDTRIEFRKSSRYGVVLTDTTKLAAGDVIYAEVKATGKNYSGTASGTYRIGLYDISKLTASLDPKAYTGKAVTISADEIKWKPVKNQPDATAAIDENSYKNNVNKGKATVDVVGTGDYCGRKTITYTIGAKGFLWWWRNLFN